MNIQLCIPYEPCVYHCPMCIARGHKHNYQFQNLYKTDIKQFTDNLLKSLNSVEFNDIILTGECDPTQNIRFLQYAIKIIRKYYPDKKIELQTHNYHTDLKKLRGLNVISYSVTSVRDYLASYSFKKPKNMTSRMVILLTNEFGFLTAENFNDMGFNQITFKTLQNGENPLINRWIDSHRLKNIENIKKIVSKFNSDTDVSVRLDQSCQDATGRYYVIRSDGLLYENWEAAEPINY